MKHNSSNILVLMVFSILSSALSSSALGQKYSSTAEIRWPATVATGEKLRTIYSKKGFYEGPSWHAPSSSLFFTAFWRGKDRRIMRLGANGRVSTWLKNSGGVNGTFISKRSTLLGAQSFGHRVIEFRIGKGTRQLKKGPRSRKTLAANRHWNQPNDICQSVDGTIFFSDPGFGRKQKGAVYSLSTSGKVKKIITGLRLPNGILTSRDGKTLYVSDTRKKQWWAYPIKADGGIGSGRIFFDPKVKNKAAEIDPDGMTIDEKGNLYLTGYRGVWVVSQAGDVLGFIPTDVFPSNVTFGGKKGQTLFITGKNKVYCLAMNVRGGHF